MAEEDAVMPKKGGGCAGGCFHSVTGFNVDYVLCLVCWYILVYYPHISWFSTFSTSSFFHPKQSLHSLEIAS